MRRRKKRQKNSESDTSRERNVAERSGVKRSGSLLLSLSVFPSLFDRLSLNISQSVSLSSFSRSLSRSLSISLLKSSPGGFLRSFRAPSTDDEETDREGRAHYFPAASSSQTRSGLRPYYSRARAARREETARTESRLGCHLLPTPGVWSMKIFSAPSLFWSSSSLPLPPALVLLLITPSTCSLPTPHGSPRLARSLARSLYHACCTSSLSFSCTPARRTTSSLDHHLLLSIPAPFRLPSFLSNQ